MKKWLALLLALAMAVGLAACSAAPEQPIEPKPMPAPVKPAPEPAVEEPEPEISNLIGISMPAKELDRWNRDGAHMKALLEDAGYRVDLQYAANHVQTQVSQIENMIAGGCKVLVIAAIDVTSLGTVMAQAKEAGVTVIAYDRLIIDTDALSYYITLDNWAVGVKQGQYIVDALNLMNAGENVYNIEFIAADFFDSGILFFYDGAMSVLQPYLDSGVLNCFSEQVDKMSVATADGATDSAKARFDDIIATYYTNKPLHAVLATNDSTAQGVAAALSDSYRNDVYPVITGQDCDIVSVQNILEGKQAMSVFKDTYDMAEKAAEMVDAIMKGEDPPINDEETYDNGTGTIPSYLCEPVVCTKDNYKELLIDSGYYTQDQLEG